jgi:hypothetical protein
MLFGGDFNQTKGDCFQVLGFDIFLDSSCKAWVLEVNDHPSLNIFLCYESEEGIVKVPSEIDKFIKVKVIGDALELMKCYPSGERHLLEDFRCWHRILPCEQSEYFDSFIRLK